MLGFEARISIREGLERYVDWVRQSEAAELAHAEAVRNW